MMHGQKNIKSEVHCCVFMEYVNLAEISTHIKFCKVVTLSEELILKKTHF